MAEIKAETSHHHYPLMVSDSGNISDQQKKQQRPKRVASLDIFRGLTVARISSRIEAVKKVILKTLKLLFWGILLQGGYSHAPDKLTYGVDVKMIRWCGILQVTCGVKGKLDPPCNAVGYIDREVLGINHIYHHPARRRSKACTQDSPYEGPLQNDAPSWCHASFKPEGILRLRGEMVWQLDWSPWKVTTRTGNLWRLVEVTEISRHVYSP
ncbi:hypothetical protein LWI29_010560 [Acer saccharum]|uniref:Uncharacterized protein n=1 Tax=Acer saccharum TaxID=4024 RepID=A0AA39W1A5_ACESA|nr:hypothetical protein LWI29_010560 [Acer saccharum]